MRVRTKTELGAAIRAERERQGLTQQELAERTGVRRLWLIETEAGRGNPTTEPLLRCLDVLGLALSVDVVESRSQRSWPSLDEVITRTRTDGGE